MNLQAVHYVMLVCGALGAGLPGLATSFPPSASPFFLASAAVFVLVATVLGVVSPPVGKKDES